MRHIILGNQSADLDSIASTIALSISLGQAFAPVINVLKKDLYLRKDVLFLFKRLAIDLKHLYFLSDLPQFLSEAKLGKLRLILVDHNNLAYDQKEWAPFVDEIIDHHHDEQVHYPQLKSKTLAHVGSTATLVAEILKDRLTI